MKNKNVVMGIIAAVAVVFIVILMKSPTGKTALKPATMPAMTKSTAQNAVKTPVKAPVKPVVKAPVKPVFAKDMGGLTVKMLNSKSQQITARVKAFRIVDDKSSINTASLSINRMQELLEGSYDIEIDTVPQKLYKNIVVKSGKETVADLGAIGAVNVKTQNSNMKDASYQVRVMPVRSKVAIITGTTNKPIEIVPDVYNVEISMIPVQVKKDVKIEAGKETTIDLGCATGALLVKAYDDNNSESRIGVRVKKSGSGELVTSWVTNRPLEIVEGMYDIDVLSNPVQSRKDIKVNKAAETVAEFKVSAPQVSVPAKAQPVKSAVPAQAKK